MLDDVQGVDDVAQRLRLGPSLWVERPAIGGDCTIWRAALGAHSAEQGRVEPSAILVAALEVEVGRPGKAWLVAQDGRVARTRLEPHIDDVHLLAEPGATAFGAFHSGGMDFLGRALV